GVPADLVVGGFGGEARGAGGHDDRGDLLLAVIARAGDGRGSDELGDVGAGVRDELLRAVDDPFAAVQLRGGLRATRVRTGLWLGQPKAGQALAGDQVGQVLLLLLL